MPEEKNPYKIIENYAKKNSLIYAIGTAEPFYGLEPVLEKAKPPFTALNAHQRINPKLILPDAKSIICIGLSYNKKYIGGFDDEIRGNISVGAVGEDYHITMARHLDNICRLLKIDGLYFSDTGPLVDRAAAIRCGLGKAGKNFSVINPKIGSMFFIGYILTSLRLKPSAVDEDFSPCGSCDLCIKACPGGAIKKDYLDFKKCISFLTQSKELKESDFKLINKQLYGCDICQKVCPYNQRTSLIQLINHGIDEFHPKTDDILSMSNKDFNLKFKNTAAGWRGKKLLQRNAVIVLSNTKNDKALDILIKHRNDNREDIKALIEWAIKSKS